VIQKKSHLSPDSCLCFLAPKWEAYTGADVRWSLPHSFAKINRRSLGKTNIKVRSFLLQKRDELRPVERRENVGHFAARKKSFVVCTR